MKVLHLIGGSEIAGSKSHLSPLLNEFNKNEVFLGVFDWGEIPEEAQQNGVKVFYLNQGSRYNVFSLLKLKRIIINENIDILHTHGPRANLFGFLVSRLVKFIWVITVHSDPRLDFMGRGILGWAFTKLNLLSLKFANHYFAISKRFKDDLVSIGIKENKITIIYNGIDFNKRLVYDTKIKRSDFGLADSDFVLIIVGRLHPIKGHSYLFHALRKVLDSTDLSVKLIVIGDGESKDDLKKLTKELNIEEAVIFLGHRNDIDQYYSLADVKVLSSLSESFPLVLLEAARAGVPIISTDVGGVNELISDPTLGWVVPTENSEELSRAILQAIDLHIKNRLKDIGERIKEKAAYNFSLEKLTDNIYNTYLYLLDKFQR